MGDEGEWDWKKNPSFFLSARCVGGQGKLIPIVSLPKMGQQSWAEPLSRSRLAGNGDVISLVDKSICSKAAVFFGTWGSTFTHDIFRWGWVGCRQGKCFYSGFGAAVCCVRDEGSRMRRW